MLELDIIKNAIHSATYGSPAGAMCIFVPITDSIGAKVYQTEEERDFAYNWQNKASDVNLGPEVHGTFEFVAEESLYNDEMDEAISAGSILYGYLTEIVEIAGNIHEDVDEFEDEHDEAITDLVRALRKIGFNFIDSHIHNLGFKDGRLICIDFGTC